MRDLLLIFVFGITMAYSSSSLGSALPLSFRGLQEVHNNHAKNIFKISDDEEVKARLKALGWVFDRCNARMSVLRERNNDSGHEERQNLLGLQVSIITIFTYHFKLYSEKYSVGLSLVDDALYRPERANEILFDFYTQFLIVSSKMDDGIKKIYNQGNFYYFVGLKTNTETFLIKARARYAQTLSHKPEPDELADRLMRRLRYLELLCPNSLVDPTNRFRNSDCSMNLILSTTSSFSSPASINSKKRSLDTEEESCRDKSKFWVKDETENPSWLEGLEKNGNTLYSVFEKESERWFKYDGENMEFF